MTVKALIFLTSSPDSQDTKRSGHDRRVGQFRVGSVTRLDRVLIGAAIGWGVVILILAIVYPVESVDTGRPGVQPMRSLVAVNGYGVLLEAAIPLLIAIVVGLLRVTRPRARWATTITWILSGALLLASLAGAVTFLIGIYVLPAAALLILALGFSGSGSSEFSGSSGSSGSLGSSGSGR
jgi:uncharacterized membrane protein YgcG